MVTAHDPDEEEENSALIGRQSVGVIRVTSR